MILKNSSYDEFANRIKDSNHRIIVYGAGMIGRIVVPYVIESHGLAKYVDCYIDADLRKKDTTLAIGDSEFVVRTPDYLESINENTVILLTNSKFYPIVDFLDGIDSLRNCECYIVPIMQRMEQRQSIPKTIHYCWFGGKELPDFLKKCIESWSTICPDYEIKRWDESNYDVNKYLYTKQAAENKKYGFITDVARLDILYEYGGVYLDTDVKLIKPFGELMYNQGFVGVESWGNINSGGGIGAVPHHPMIKEMLDYRLKYPFIYDDGTLNIETNGFYETVPFLNHGMRIDNTLQIVNGMTVYPTVYFHPYDYMSGEETITDDTVSVHYFSGGWMEEEDRKNRLDTQKKYSAITERICANLPNNPCNG